MDGIEFKVRYLTYESLAWESDWNGYEVGYDEVLVVGLYRIIDTNVYMYINTVDNEILETWSIED